jgi:hypothetical protein
MLNKADASSRFIVATHGEITSRSSRLGWLRPDLVVVDEAGTLGAGGVNPRSKTFVAHRDLAARSMRSVLATATPVATAHALDLRALMEVGHIPGTPSRVDLDRYVTYAEVLTEYGRTRKFPVSISQDGLSRLILPLAGSAVRTTIESVGGSLPSVRRDITWVPLGEESRRAYSRAADIRGLPGHQMRAAASRAPQPLVAAAVECLEAGIGSSGHGKIVVFTDNFDILNPLVDALENEGEEVRRLIGSMTSRQRSEAVEWHRAGGRRILAGTEALETGLNLQYSSFLMSVVPSWNPARERQREGRLRRFGSPFTEVAHAIIRPDVPLEERKDLALERKDAVADQVLSAVPAALQLDARGRST